MKNYSFVSLVLLSLFFVASCKKTDEVSPSEELADWTTASHSNQVDPNYSVVFPQNSVNTIEISMTSSDWTNIKSDIKSKYSIDFGTGSSTTGGGAAPGGGAPPAGGGAPGGNGGGAISFGTGEPNYVAVKFKFNGKEWYHVGFRLKGNSSLTSIWRSGIYKLPFRLKFDEFEDTYPAIKNQRLYGFHELSMSPGYSDNSLIREKVVADIFRMGGIPAAQTSFCKVYIDFGEGQKYCGVYTMVEVIDDTMVKNQFGDDKGNIYKPESTFQSFAQSEFEKKNNEDAADYSDVKAIIEALNSSLRTSNASQWRTNFEKVFNVDHFIKWLAINTAIVNWDSYGRMAHNYYLYTSPTKGVTWIPWDHNMSMTSSTTSGQQTGGGNMSGLSLALSEVTSTWPLIRYVADDPVYYAKYKAYMKDFSENTFTSAKMNDLFERNFNLISPYVVGPQETEKSPYSNLTSSSVFTSELSSLKQHVVTRNSLVKDFTK
ncbi:MAG: CotH kinase family protein [Spirosomataceae bacterium]